MKYNTKHKKLRQKIINRVLLLKKLHHVDEKGNVLLNKKYMIPKWIDCLSCKFMKEENIGKFKPQFCSQGGGKPINQISISWTGFKKFRKSWICLVHKFKKDLDKTPKV